MLRSPDPSTSAFWSDEQKLNYLTERFREIMLCLGMDLLDPSLVKSPSRAADLYFNHLLSGLKEVADRPLAIEESVDCGVVTLKTAFYSLCEHHFVPMFGTVYVAYLPVGKLIGISSLIKLIEQHAHRPQLQERLTVQIAQSLSLTLDTPHVAVCLKARHFCALARQIGDSQTEVTSWSFSGDFQHSGSIRAAFMQSL